MRPNTGVSLVLLFATALSLSAERGAAVPGSGGWIRVKLAVRRGSGAPSHVRAQVVSASAETDAAAGQPEECIGSGSSWRCAVPPDTSVDLRIDADDYAPAWLTDVHAAAGTEVDAGEVTLRHAATVVGRIKASANIRMQSVSVELVPHTINSGAAAARRQRAASRRTTVSARGFFQFRNVAGGDYDLIARGRDAASRSIGLEVRELTEHDVGAVELHPLVRLDVAIDPAIPEIGKNWSVKLAREVADSGRVTDAGEGHAAFDGHWTREALAPGTYIVDVRDDRGELAKRERVVIGNDRVSLSVHLPRTPVRGTVRAGSSRLPSIVELTSDGVHVKLPTDDDGEFSGVLPHEGKWSLTVWGKDSMSYVRTRAVDVKRSEGGGPAVIDVTLPGGRVIGSVTDETGRPATADVMVYREGTPFADCGTDDDGHFRLAGVEPGELSLRALNGDADTGLVAYSATETAPVEAHLVMRKLAAFKAWLTTEDSEPVAGALVRIFGPTIPGRQEAITGLDGTVEVRISQTVQPLTLVILAPSFPVKVVSLQFDPAARERAQIVLRRNGGVLSLLLDRKAAPPWIATAGTTRVPLAAMLFRPGVPDRDRQAGRDGIHLELEPALYSVCASPAGAPCRNAAVTPGGETVVDAGELIKDVTEARP